MSSMAPFGTLNFDNDNYSTYESDCDSTNYYADKEYSGDELDDSERDDVSNVDIKEEVIDTRSNDIGSYEYLSESGSDDDHPELYTRKSFPNNNFVTINNNNNINNNNVTHDESFIMKMEKSSPFGSEQQDSNFVKHYIEIIQAQNSSSKSVNSSDETISTKMERYENGDSSGDETVYVKMESREHNGLEDDNTLHKVKIGSCDHSNCKKRDVHENDQPVEIKIESFEDFNSLEKFLRYDDTVSAKMKSNELFSESNVKIEQTEKHLSSDSLEEFLLYDETIRAKMEPCGRSFYDEEQNLGDNNQTAHIKMGPYEPFYEVERNLSDYNQTVHVKTEPYNPFYGDERNLSDNNQSVHVKAESYEPFYGGERNLSDNNQTVHISYEEQRNNNQTVHVKTEPYEPFCEDERNLSDNNQTIHTPYESFYEGEKNLSYNHQTAHIPYEPFYGGERNLCDNQTVHVKTEPYEPYEPFYGGERNLGDNQTVRIKMEPYEPFNGEERGLTDKYQPRGPAIQHQESLEELLDYYRPPRELVMQYESRDSLEEFLRYDETIRAEMEPYGSFHNNEQALSIKVEPCELFNDKERKFGQTSSTETESREFFSNEEESLSDESYESSNGNDIIVSRSTVKVPTADTAAFYLQIMEGLKKSDGYYKTFKTFKGNTRDNATVNIKSNEPFRNEKLCISDNILSYGENCDKYAGSAYEQVNEYNLSNSDNAHSSFEGNNNIANKIMDNSEINHFWNQVPSVSRQSPKRKFDDIYQEQCSEGLLSTTKPNVTTTSSNGTTGENSQKRCRLSYRMNERHKCYCGKLFRNSASFNRHQKLIHYKYKYCQ
ncbi:hypothetical protein RclHR1_21090001 [Rhizophagus clarus]|nr:hypothetical protein RclHR1_21090001 [Rhizophagus clarus]